MSFMMKTFVVYLWILTLVTTLKTKSGFIEKNTAAFTFTTADSQNLSTTAMPMPIVGSQSPNQVPNQLPTQMPPNQTPSQKIPSKIPTPPTQTPPTQTPPTQTPPTQTPPTQTPPTQTPPPKAPTQFPSLSQLANESNLPLPSEFSNISITSGQSQTPSQNPTQSPEQNPFTQEPGDTCIVVKWTNTELLAFDVGVGAQGDVYAVGIDGFLYYYIFLSNEWIRVEGDFELTSIARVDVSYDGTPYVVTACGDTFYLSCDHRWVRLPGCATDIGVGRGGEVFKIGCDNRGTGGNGIYRLFCDSTCECKQSCFRFRQGPKCPESSCVKKPNCFWFRVEGSGTRIDVAPSGYPVVVNALGSILINDGTNWTTANTSIKAEDITVSNENQIFFTSAQDNVYRLIDPVQGTVLRLCGTGTAISAGPFSEPFVIQTDKNVYTSAKQGYN